MAKPRKVKLYRIENDDGVGPYAIHALMTLRSAELVPEPEYYTVQVHPGPMHDGIPEFKNGVHRSAFKSLCQLRRWFPRSILVALQDAGLSIVCVSVEAKHVLHGGMQSAYAAGTEDQVFVNWDTVLNDSTPSKSSTGFRERELKKSRA